MKTPKRWLNRSNVWTACSKPLQSIMKFPIVTPQAGDVLATVVGAADERGIKIHFIDLREEHLAAMLGSGAIGEALVSAVLEQRPARLAGLRFAGEPALRTGRTALARSFDATCC